MTALAFPIADVEILLQMVQGSVPFDLPTATRAAFAIAEYALSLFGKDVAARTGQGDFTLETMLADLKDSHDEGGLLLPKIHGQHERESVNAAFWIYLISQLETWLEQKQSGQS